MTRWMESASLLMLVAAMAVTAACATGVGDGSPGLAGQWTLNQERTVEVQPENRTQRKPLGRTGTAVVVGGIPLPTPGSTPLPSAPGSAPDPTVLHTPTLTIEPGEDELTLVYAGGERETLKRGDDQGLISQWSSSRLTSRYETTSRKVSQVYQVQRDGSLLVTVRLNPNQGSTLVHKRVFDRAGPP